MGNVLDEPGEILLGHGCLLADMIVDMHQKNGKRMRTRVCHAL